MIPNVFPAVVIFGLMGWCQYLDRNWLDHDRQCRDGNRRGRHFSPADLVSPRVAAACLVARLFDFALQRCAGAMIHTTLVCSCALLVFSFSSFMPIAGSPG